MSLLKIPDEYISSQLNMKLIGTSDFMAPSGDFTFEYISPSVAKIACLDPFAEPKPVRNRAELVLMKIDQWREGNPR